MNTATLPNGAMQGGAVALAAPAVSTALQLPEAPASVTVKVMYRGFDVMLTLRDIDGRAALGKLDAALGWFEAHGATPAPTYNSRPARQGAPIGDTTTAAAPVCPTHNRPMKPGRKGGFFCPTKIADDDGTGRPVYCRHRG